ncbi:DUF3995 domain-containing protein [Flavobacterium hydrophilum]|uniref:DUF3995 domain-containing protein n=1 Tax=Flavobacterium hydrophilum TaxID=2211445 RepID=A0A2V4CAI4_9FLAO|nr:DUF3995 domain-containing protein [Flavobacterium hydrophilum]PXY47163.1 DUF3995 domain-containing protein [Flavobacterium hydrophilum]
MIQLISIILFLVFLFLSSIHWYWAFGGKWGTQGVYPANPDGSPMRPPGIAATLIVAIGLLSFGIFYLIKGEFVSIELPFWLNKNGLWILTGIFIVRAIGDFKYLGFFKKIKNSKFAINDSKYYSPLCFAIGVLTLILGLDL